MVNGTFLILLTMTEYGIGDRLQVEDDICTVKFIGKIESWPTEIALGVEWDNAERGRHSGEINGKVYFVTSRPGAGSFLKLSKVQRIPRFTFLEALRDAYGSSEKIGDNLYIGGKKIENFGFERLNALNSNYESLKSVSLVKKSINRAFGSTDDSKVIAQSLRNVQSLDLGYNLFSTFAHICDLLDNLRSLTTVNISGNKIDDLDSHILHGGRTYPRIKELYVVNCNLSSRVLKELFKIFPSVEILDASGNDLSELTEKDLEGVPQSLRELRLSNTGLTYIPSVILKSKVETLDLSDNFVASLPDGVEIVSDVRVLDLSHNSITQWDIIDQINVTFPNLSSLNIEGNPAFTQSQGKWDSDRDTVWFLNTLARFDNLKRLNGTILSENDRVEAETYFVSQIIQGQVTYDRNLRRWSYLDKKYGIERAMQRQQQRSLPRDKWINKVIVELTFLSKKHGNELFKSKFLRTSTVRYVKGFVASKLGADIFEIRLHRCVGDKVFEELEREFSQIRDMHLDDGDSIFVEV